MSDEFDIDSVTNYASLTTTCPNIGEISGIAIEAFSRVCKFSMFEITSISQCKKKTYGILRTDWKTHFKCEEISSVFAYVRGDTSEHIYILLNEENLLHLKELKPKFFETYVAQRYIFPDNQDIIERPTKKFEFELGFQLFTLLSDLLVFKHQKNILNYQADFILELKNNFNGDIPSIVVEIDEDEHASYTPENEKLRQSVIEAYNNRMIHISVKRTSTQQDIEEISVKYSKIIRNLAKELTTDYSFEFDEEDFIRILQDNTVEPNFIKMFFDNKTGDPKFRYYMSDVGDFLGYESTRNYERLKKFLTLSPRFEEDVDWKV
jgi:very-short-patch-repair endonuclease